MKAIEILLVEDNPGDVRMMSETFKKGKVHNNLSVAMDGTEAIAFLRREGKYINAPRPDLILLDLKIPKKDGKEVLAEIKNDPDLKRIPVVIVTASDAEKDLLESYNLHANCYIIKPVGLDRFRAVMESIENFWFTVVKLPPGD
ncbi:putative methanogenesis regulatory protein FilR2 [uncultured archaeon]|nr:putative methanogenesis regulatory protein FilR2 [uncultured archaeon]